MEWAPYMNLAIVERNCKEHRRFEINQSMYTPLIVAELRRVILRRARDQAEIISSSCVDLRTYPSIANAATALKIYVQP